MNVNVSNRRFCRAHGNGGQLEQLHPLRRPGALLRSPPTRSTTLARAETFSLGGKEGTAYEKGGVGNGKPDPPKHTIYRGRPHLKNPRYSGFQGLLGVSCPSLQRLDSSVGFGTRTRMAPKKRLRALRTTAFGNVMLHALGASVVLAAQ
jgi:hypothetical protein